MARFMKTKEVDITRLKALNLFCLEEFWNCCVLASWRAIAERREWMALELRLKEGSEIVSVSL
jgi:hypothetical protein